MNRNHITLCSVTMVVGVLAWNPPSGSTPTTANQFCSLGAGVGGGLHGAVIEPCTLRSDEMRSGEGFTSISNFRPSESQEPTPNVDPIVEIGAFFVHDLLMHDALISMVP